MHVQAALHWIRHALIPVALPLPSIEAEQLLCTVLQCSRTALLVEPYRRLTQKEEKELEALLQRRLSLEPLAYLLQKAPFWTLDALLVTADVLIPRPETECLVELVLGTYGQEVISLLDLGTGSGAIALALAKERPQWSVVASDNSIHALAVARENAQRHGLERVHFAQSDWFSNIEGIFNVIVANPPYIDKDDVHAAKAELAYEPPSALYSEEAGLRDLRVIIEQAKTYLAPGGMLAVEHGFMQAEAVCGLFAKEGYSAAKTIVDLNGQPRVSYGFLST